MRTKRLLQLSVAGVLTITLAGCDQVESRLEKFGQLVGEALSQVSGEETPADPLADAPLEARALFGVRLEPVEVQPASLDELLQTQSYFAVGSVIAKPREDLVEPVVDEETFDVAAAQPDPNAPADGAESAELPASASAPAGPPVEEAAPPPPPPVETAPAPGVAPPTTAEGGAARAPRSLRMKAPPVLSAPEMQRQVQDQPKVLEEDVKKSGVRVSREAVRNARRVAVEAVQASTEEAQRIGDEVAKQAADPNAPAPKLMAVRSKLKTDVALQARERAYNKLEELGLSGIVTPEEGGQMRILLDVKPMRMVVGDRINLTRVDQAREMFAEKKEKPADECAGDPTREQLQSDAVLATECVVKLLRETGEYEYVEKDFIFSNQMLRKPKKKPAAVTAYLPNDPLFGLQWHFKDNGAAAGQSGGGASFASFWEKNKDTGSKDVVVAVIDTGLQMNHPDIKGSANLAAGYDMVSDPYMGNDGDGRDADPNDPGDRCDPNDPTVTDTFHGTHVAGTIGVASTNNKSGVAGGAWNVTIVPVRALGRCGGKLSDINDAIRWAAGKVPARDAQGAEVWNKNPADIINLSIGLFEPCPASMQAAIDDAVKAGALVVAAAGNARIDTKYFAPGGCKNVISVAAGDARGQLTPYSNFGANVNIMAPGGDMTRDDDGDGRPDGVLSTKFSSDCYDPAKPGTKVAQCYYSYENGTSMAAPHVSAALALLKTKFPQAVPSELRSRLLASSTARAPLQCSGKCTSYPGTDPIPGQDGMCFRPCGGAMLNLANAAVQ